MSPAIARFEVVAGRALGMSILVDDELLIGRHADGAGRLADDEEISRSHARISLDRSGFCAIEDLGSTNGTFVNGLRITGPQTLSVGDTMELGGTTLVVRELPIPTTERSLKAVHPQPTVVPRAGSASQETPAVAVGPSGRPQRGPHVPERQTDNRATPAPASVTPDAAADPDVAADPDAPAAPAATPASLSLTLHVDLSAREATVALNDGPDAIKLVFDGTAWRPAAP
jgi:pSer/pThr/pTyr-binding forkhead associated (FHA) protein